MRAAILASLLLVAAPPDLVPPGHKRVRHELLLEWGDGLQGWSFVAYPTRGFHGPHPIERGVPFPFSSKYGTRIYAAPSGAALPESREAWLAVGWPSAAPPVAEVATIAISHPLARTETLLRAVTVGADGVELERVTTRRFDADGAELGGLSWLPLAVIAAAGAAFLLLLQRRVRSPRATADA